VDFLLNDEQKKLQQQVITLCREQLQPLEEKL
jgi:hypothetical protein